MIVSRLVLLVSRNSTTGVEPPRGCERGYVVDESSLDDEERAFVLSRNLNVKLVAFLPLLVYLV